MPRFPQRQSTNTEIVKHFDSVPELVRYAMNGERSRAYQHEHDSLTGWYDDGIGLDESIKRAIHGDTELMDDVQSLLDQMTTPEIEGNVWMPSVAGAFPCVPEYLSGNPECMRLQTIHESERAPIRVYVSQFVSASYDAKDAIRRGVAIAALVMRLQVTHPVDLYLVSAFCSPDRIVCTHVGTLPIDMSTLVFNLAHVSIFRRFGMPSIFENWKPQMGSSALDDLRTKRYLDIGPKDLYIESSVSYDGILTDPIKWINEQVLRFNGLTPEKD